MSRLRVRVLGKVTMWFKVQASTLWGVKGCTVKNYARITGVRQACIGLKSFWPGLQSLKSSPLTASMNATSSYLFTSQQEIHEREKTMDEETGDLVQSFGIIWVRRELAARVEELFLPEPLSVSLEAHWCRPSRLRPCSHADQCPEVS